MRNDKVTDKPTISLRPKPGLSAEEAREIRALAWEHVFRSFKENRKRAGGTAPNDDVKESESDCAAKQSIPRG